MEHRLVYRNSDGVRRTSIVDDEYPGVLRVNTEVMVDGIAQSIERDRAEVKAFSTNKLVARVPMTIYEQSIHEGWDEDRWKKWLNSLEAAPFRIWQGRV